CCAPPRRRGPATRPRRAWEARPTGFGRGPAGCRRARGRWAWGGGNGVSYVDPHPCEVDVNEPASRAAQPNTGSTKSEPEASSVGARGVVVLAGGAGLRAALASPE